MDILNGATPTRALVIFNNNVSHMAPERPPFRQALERLLECEVDTTIVVSRDPWVIPYLETTLGRELKCVQQEYAKYVCAQVLIEKQGSYCGINFYSDGRYRLRPGSIAHEFWDLFLPTAVTHIRNLAIAETRASP